jgi:capsular exopolysaccharide synthesis family protein
MSKAEGPPKTILVTSPSGGDGKSTTCMNTAIALANQGSRVILIDADMRRPSIDRLTDINESAGLSNLLTSHLDPSSFIQRHRAVANLWLLPAGDPTPVPADLLASKRFRDVLNQLSERYDFVLIDSPPLLLVTDALLIATRVDSVILVVRSGSTSRSALRETSRMLRNVRVRPLGNVLNGVGKGSSSYPYRGLIIEYDKSERSERYAS